MAHILPILENYARLLWSISPKKLDALVMRVKQSAEAKQASEAEFFSLFGAFESEHTAEELILQVRESRTSYRTPPEL